jgi:hypothetical protein
MKIITIYHGPGQTNPQRVVEFTESEQAEMAAFDELIGQLLGGGGFGIGQIASLGQAALISRVLEGKPKLGRQIKEVLMGQQPEL